MMQLWSYDCKDSDLIHIILEDLSKITDERESEAAILVLLYCFAKLIASFLNLI